MTEPSIIKVFEAITWILIIVIVYFGIKGLRRLK
jgi:capsule polysaccharide export protein KpsE/RkpR